MTQIKEAFQNKVSGKGRGQVSVVDDEYEDDDERQLKEDCGNIGISAAVIWDGGDYRQIDGKVYWLPLALLYEFEVKDQNTESDDDFYDWATELLERENLEHRKPRKSWNDWKPTWETQSVKKKIGSWWSSWGYSSDGASGTELTKRLVVALKAITTTVGVVNTTGKRYRVRLASTDSPETPTSYTAYEDRLIVVSPQALLDTSIEQDTGIEITTGYALHEASHVQYSEPLTKALSEPSRLRPLAIASLLHNLLEDMRIEHLTGLKFPGFADFFVTANNYLWDVAASQHSPKTWGPSLNEKLNAAIQMVKFGEHYKPTVDQDPGLTAEWPWWTEWAETYVAGGEPIRQSLIRALEHLAEDEDTKKEMDEQTEKEEEHEKQSGQSRKLTDKEFQDLLDQLKGILDPNGTIPDPCPSPGQEEQQVELSEEQAEELEDLLSQQFQQFEAEYKMRDGKSLLSPIIEVRKPLMDKNTKRFYKAPGGMVERLREVFYFRKVKSTETERLLKGGLVDEEELWRVGVGDVRVFERTTQPEETYTSVTMLVDASGSMMGSGLVKAQELANVMLACLRTQRGVTVRVRAHTTGYDDVTVGETCEVFRIWEPGDEQERLGLLQEIDHGANFDGFAIDWCAKELRDNAEPNEQLLLLVLSDGLPNGTINNGGNWAHYGGGPAMDHMFQLGDYWARQGVSIVQIAIDHDLRPEDQKRMFRNWVGYENDQKLLFDLTNVLMRAFGAIE